MKPPSSRDIQTDAQYPNRRETASEQTVIIGEGSGAGTPSNAAIPPSPPPPPNPIPVAPAAQPVVAQSREPPKPVMTPQPQPQPQSAADSGHTRLLGHPGMAPAPDMTKGAPVVGWFVVVDGKGKGEFRPIFPGSNTVGRSASQRIPINFGDDSISSDKQAYVIYDGRKRQFQLVPNLEKSNLVELNGSAVLANSELKAKDRVTLGQTTLLFVPLCGEDFDWSETK